jgi:subtilisin family serine protease
MQSSDGRRPLSSKILINKLAGNNGAEKYLPARPMPFIFYRSRGGMNKILSNTLFIVTVITFCAASCFAQDRSAQTIATLFLSSKIKRPEILLRDFVDDESTARVIINLSRPVTFDQPRSFKDHEFRRKFLEAVNTAQNRVTSRMDSSKIRITNRFIYTFGLSAEVTLKGLNELAEINEVVSIEKDEILEAHLAQGIPLIYASSVRNTYDGAGVAMAICDTGIDYMHPNLGGGAFPNEKVIGGYDTGDGDNDPMDENGHGTCCAGIAAGDIGTVGDYIGGVAPNAKLYALKISLGNSGSAYISDMIEAWEWCITHQNDDPSHPILVITTSFGAGQYLSICDSASPVVAYAAANVTAAGINLFASSGNNGYCGAINAPACISDVISVGAVYDAGFGTYYPCISSDSCATKYETGGCETGYFAIDSTAADIVASYSNTASFLDLLAPSNQTYTTDITGPSGYSMEDYYSSFGGTSAASPYAAGAAVCLQSAAKGVTGTFLTPAEVRSKLTNTGDWITDGKIAIAAPRVNLSAAVNSLPELVVKRIVLRNLDNDIVSKDFSPGTDIQYKVRFTVNGDPSKLYKVAANGAAVSLYKPDGINPEWIDNFGSKRKAKKLYVGEVKKIQWNRQIPDTATTDKRARVKLTLRLREYDESTGTWNKLGHVRWRKDFNIVP